MAALTTARAWVHAARPRTLYAIAAPVMIGAALAYANGVFRWGPAVAALAGGLLIQIGTNIANDYYDFVKGADTADRLGAPRVTQSGLLPAAAVKRGMWVVFAAAVAVGVYLVGQGGWPVLVVGVAAIAAGLGYTAGPVPIGYVGLGDLFTFVFFGPVAVAGTYFVQAGTLTWGTLLAGAGVGALATAILVVNNLRDIPTDRAAGKRTLAVRLGVQATRIEYVLLLLLGGAVPVVGLVMDTWPPTVLLALPAFAFGADAVRRVMTFTDPRTLNPALGGTARFVGVYGLTFAIGVVF